MCVRRGTGCGKVEGKRDGVPHLAIYLDAFNGFWGSSLMGGLKLTRARPLSWMLRCRKGVIGGLGGKTRYPLPKLSRGVDEETLCVLLRLERCRIHA